MVGGAIDFAGASLLPIVRIPRRPPHRIVRAKAEGRTVRRGLVETDRRQQGRGFVANRRLARRGSNLARGGGRSLDGRQFRRTVNASSAAIRR
jgi:hypothetical protein